MEELSIVEGSKEEFRMQKYSRGWSKSQITNQYVSGAYRKEYEWSLVESNLEWLSSHVNLLQLGSLVQVPISWGHLNSLGGESLQRRRRSCNKRWVPLPQPLGNLHEVQVA
ncbi:hypothetical protein VNO78_25648 [Psophocarpus tetragonolobus]|uniref:Uncharacterized protein n=1 Tax=Psophocarpus tetragonolobus TaxID=3891 RepID=A0AAN9XFJ0_PSOTE